MCKKLCGKKRETQDLVRKTDQNNEIGLRVAISIFGIYGIYKPYQIPQIEESKSTKKIRFEELTKI